MPGKLFLIPSAIADDQKDVLTSEACHAIGHIRCFLAENIPSARRSLKKIIADIPLPECEFFELSEHTPIHDAKEFFEKNLHQDIGIISEAGCPAVADPGAAIVSFAHQKKMEVVVLVGPSSILLALMASGLNGQNFAFNGYLPKDKNDRLRRIKDLEKRSRLESQTQIIMETPYRNQQLFEELVSSCLEETMLCVASGLLSRSQYLRTQLIGDWKKENPPIHKIPSLFLISAQKL